MNKITLSHIVATSQNHVIGNEGKLPWDIPEDLKYFFNKTRNKILIMGRKTFDSLGQALPSRLNIVLTRNQGFKAQNTVVFPNFDQALEYAQQKEILEKYDSEIFIGGGAEIYKQTLNYMDRLYVTRIHKNYEGDTFYPEIPSSFKEVSRIDKKDPVPFSFLVYEKIKE